MKRLIAFTLAAIFLGSLIGCNQQESRGQNDNGAQFYFSATVIEQNEEYLMLEVFDAGNSNLSKGAKVEVSTTAVPADELPKFSAYESARVIMAQNASDNPPGRLEAIAVHKRTETATNEEKWDLIPMVMVDGVLYLDTGHDSTDTRKCGVFDGEITSEVGGGEQPTKNDQSNFGTGYGYQYGAVEGTIEVCMNERWRIFATEQVRQELQFPEKDDERADWGIALSTRNVTATGMTLVCTQSGGEPTGKLQCGSDYSLLAYSNGGWNAVPHLPDEVAWNEIAYLVPKNDSIEFELDWEWLYGKLSPGTYRIMKGFMDFRGAGDYDTQTYYADFEITR